ncbi:Phosphoesterase, PA-phosphatase related protein [Trichormus variabilis ATCC 29413]|uniref:Phosphoesterase, PA-phosphatase related protein n=2 Tax=Anabaena variabilis TaxID=264691 RepID=Q3M312_TRIV2|nr:MULTISPECIES: phosphatase PAP2 family protein [Nostocaceae]ABA24624.1 Phosphoesterase, PA-phosphatase related protein [Trichormus variabilis ATCC 29413]MBC1213471.1 phosphatase PAP2 family protein [Trichormus variabilis ARAD]MBC1258548.1 phosphatase PAP2 family protein [Trichormus variabilis V5]MBC1266492.1 phosphatase PAP2 family protein [Trichormus variabilis FSR]MBC1301962.1 phosphatase PAP2 family protein [Trichormus variabilis N2B]
MPFLEKVRDEKLRSPIGFVQRLLTIHWRSLLVLFLGVYIPLQIFGLLALEVRYNEGGFPWDLPILVTLHAVKLPNLDIFAAILTKFGSFWTIAPTLTVIGLILLLQRRWRSLSYLLITAAGSATINRTAKIFWHRVRPHLWESVAPEFDYSFPSGHAMTSMTLIAILVVLTWGSTWRWLTVILGSVYILAIGWTRLYLGVHFPSDIIAGWMVAIAWAIGVSFIIRPLSQAANITTEKPMIEAKLLPEERELLHNE